MILPHDVGPTSHSMSTFRLCYSKCRSICSQILVQQSRDSASLYFVKSLQPERRRMSAVASALAPQIFANNPLNRSSNERKDPDFIAGALQNCQIIMVAAPAGSLGDGPVRVLPFLLGQDRQTSSWVLAANVVSLVPHLSDLEFIELRTLLSSMNDVEISMAGQAVALSQWHASQPFCSRCGQANRQTEAGLKLQCTANPQHRFYPRTDPVAIMMVESQSGTHALLGRPKKLRTGVLTCLSGFIEQGESIEEAVRREVMEEAGIKVSSVAILGSQPWPIGRGGSCELMIGCIAKAQSDDLHQDDTEMDEVRWVDKSEVRKAIQISRLSRNFDGKGSEAEGLDFFIPPRWAIAHNLIATWAEADQPWFSKL